MPRFSKASREKLETCDIRLQTLFEKVVEGFDCTITCGLRTLQEQQTLYAQGRTMPGEIVTNCDGILKKSNHQSEDDISKAVDAVPYPIDWKNRDRFIHFAGYVKGVADTLGIKIAWGGDWDNDHYMQDENFPDFPHFELEV